MFGALPVALIVRDHAVMAAFSTASVAFMFLFAIIVIMFAFMPATHIAGKIYGLILIIFQSICYCAGHNQLAHDSPLKSIA